MNTPRILVVEDEGIIARDIEQLLRSLGYNPVDVVASGEEAVARVAALRPDLVLMDIQLAGPMDGVEAAVQVRERYGVPSVFLTAYATDAVVERAKAAEPLGYIIKPFDEQSLRSTVEIALHKNKVDSALRATEARYRALVQSAPDALVTVNSQGLVVGWSPVAARMFGYGDAEVLGHPVEMLLVPAEREQDARLWAAQAALVEPQQPARLWEGTGQRKDGSVFPLERSMARWEGAEGWCVTAFIRDVTQRKQDESSIRLQSTALLATANGIVITDKGGTIEWVNPAFSAMTGYSKQEAVGKNLRDLAKSGAHPPEFYRQLWTTLSSGVVWEGEFINRRKDGSLYTEHQTITPVLNAHGAITHYVGIKRDMTGQKRLQEQFQQAQKMEVVGRLAGGVAHDFNNLLTIIKGTVDLALLDLPPQSTLREDLEQIQQAGERGARLTRQLLAFSRKQVLAPAAVNLSNQMEVTARMLRRLIGEDISLVLDLAPKLDDVFVDAGQMEQVLLNLAVNARDAMPYGGTLTVETRNVEVEVGFAQRNPGLVAGPGVMVSVRDTGTGMAAEVLQNIFEPFFTTKDPGKGTGLGLATVYGVVQQSGGGIVVESEPGRGSCFKVYLPRADSTLPVAPVAARVRSALASRGTETILLAEDEDSLRAVTARMLQAAGYHVLTANGGAQALALAAEHQGVLHALVTDVVMPGMGGPELAAALQLARPGIKVLFTSGYVDDRISAKGATMDAAHFLAKPYAVAALTEKLRQVLDG